MTTAINISARARTIGPYEVLSVLGEGGMAIVYLAQHQRSGQRVALKTVRRAEVGRLSRLRREIRALSQLRHPGIVRVLDEGVDGGLPWYAMELLDGRTFADLIASAHQEARSRAPIDEEATTQQLAAAALGPDSAAVFLAEQGAPREARPPAAGGQLLPMLQIVRELCVALAFLHGEGIVHRDLKPENIGLADDGAPVILDFGLAARTLGQNGREVLDVPLAEGTVAYIAPEQIAGHFVDARADLYAVGCLIYEAITGAPPFGGESLQATLAHHLATPPRPPSELVAGVPLALDELVLRLLEKQPRRRLGHADSVARALEELGAAPLRPPASIETRAYVYRPELVGRTAALNELLVHLERAQRDQGGIVLLRGESGIGKTSLAMELARKAAERMLQVSTGSCVPIAASACDAEPSPGATLAAPRDARLHPFQPFLRALVDRCLAAGPGASASLFGERGPVLAACAPDVREIPEQAALPDPPELPPDAAHERLLRAMADTIFAACAWLPLLIVLDDLHWADELSLDLLALLAADPRLPGAALLILGTYRVEEAPPSLVALEAKRRATRLDLGRLDPAGVGAMVGHMLALDDSPAPFVAFLNERSGGNPFFVTEYLRTAVAEGLLRRDHAGRWELGASAESAAYDRLPLPGSLRELIVHHLDLLSAKAREVALCASVIGRELDAELLRDVARLDDVPLLDALCELHLRHVLDEPAPGRLRFLHDRLREAAYALVPDGSRKELHLRAALALEARHAGSPALPRLYPQLAHHFTRAGATAKAIAYLRKAAVDALSQCEHRKAIAFLHEAIALSERHLLGLALAEERRTVKLIAAVVRSGRVSAVDQLALAHQEALLGVAYVKAGELPIARRHAYLALAWTGRPQPATPLGLSLAALRGALTHAAHHLLPSAFWRPTDKVARKLCGERGRALYVLSEYAYYNKGGLSFLASTLDATNFTEASDDTSRLSPGYASMGIVAAAFNADVLARHYLSLARAAAPAADESIHAYIDWTEMTMLMMQARWDEALSRGASAERRAERIGDRYTLIRVGANRTLIAHLKGDLTEAIACAERSARVCEEVGDSSQGAIALSVAGGALAMIGRQGDAEARLEQAERLLGADPSEAAMLQHLPNRATSLRRAGRIDDAVSAIDRALAKIRPGMPAPLTYATYSAAIDIYVELLRRRRLPRSSDRARARRMLRRALRGLFGCALQLDLFWPIYRAFHGVVLSALGSARRARFTLLRAAAGARAYGLRYHEALAYTGLANLEAAGSPERSALLDRAEQGFRRCGVVMELDICRELRDP